MQHNVSHFTIGDPATLIRWGLYGILLAGVLAVMFLVAQGNEQVLLVLPIALLLPVAVILAVRYPLVNLAILLSLFALASRNETGIGARELMFAAYFAPYIALWYGTRLFAYRETLIRQRGDLALILFLVWVGVALPWGLMAGGSPTVAASELANFSLLALYFPFRELCLRERHGALWLMGFLVVLALIAVAQNLINFTGVISRAVDLRGIATGRVTVNEVLIYFGAISSLGGLIYLRDRTSTLLWGAAFLLCSFGVIVTQFRAFYLGFAIAIAVGFVLVQSFQRKRLLIITTIAGIGMALVAWVVLGEMLAVFVSGIIDRTLSIGTAHHKDISMVNRLIEYQYTWSEIFKSPIIGQGLGAEFGFYDAIYKNTRTKPYIHNAYMHLWYKLGLVGLALFVYLCIIASIRGFRAVRSGMSRTVQASGFFVVASLCGLAVAGIASVLYNSDTMLPLVMCFAIAAAMEQRSERLHSVGRADPGGE